MTVSGLFKPSLSSLTFLCQGRSGDCELTLSEDDEITCVDEGIAIRFFFDLHIFMLKFAVQKCSWGLQSQVQQGQNMEQVKEK